MAKFATIQTNFSGGELSPLIYSGRVDTAKYPNGVARMENFHATVQGGAVSRRGSLFAGFAKGQSRLIPFVRDRTSAFQLEFGALYVRIWRVGGAQIESSPGVPLELVTPYSYGEVSILEYEQAEDTMFLFHTGYMPRRIQYLDDTHWKIETAPFVTAPFSEQGFASAIGVTLSSAAVGAGITATAASPVFLPGDVGRGFEAGLGVAIITGYTSTTAVTITTTSAFASTAIPAWLLTDSPFALLYASQKDPVGSTVTLSSSITRAATLTLTAKTGAITINADAAVFVAGDTGKTLYADSGVVVLTFVGATQCTGTTSSDFLRLSYQTGAWGITGDAFRASDVGGYVRLNSGLFLITSFTSASVVQAKIKVSPTALVAAPAEAWSLSQAAFSATNGYPRCGALHEQRLDLAGSVAEPQAIKFSRIGEYLNFEPGLLDADGYDYTLNTRQRNPIIHLVSGKRLFVFTSGLEASLRGGNEKAMGPTNTQKETESVYSCSDVKPVPVGREVLFVEGGNRKVRALGYSAAIDGYDSPDRTVFAEHITATGPAYPVTGVQEMSFDPSESLLHCVRGDGVAAVCAYEVSQEVIAWARYITTGTYLSISVAPTPTGEEVRAIVARTTAGGITSYCVEMFDESVSTDCAGFKNTADAGPPFSDTITGLDRFEGMELAVKADDVYMGLFTVSGGAITIPRVATGYIEAGLPFLPLIEMLPPEVPGGSTAQGSNLSVHEVVVRLLDVTSLAINGVLGDFRQFGEDLLDQPPPGFTGDLRAIKLTDNLYRDTLVFTQPQPFRTRIQAVIRKCTFNDV